MRKKKDHNMAFFSQKKPVRKTNIGKKNTKKPTNAIDSSMVPCKKYSKEVLSSFMDGELPPDEMATIKRHVDGCATCHRTIQTYRSFEAPFISRVSASFSKQETDILTERIFDRTVQRPSLSERLRNYFSTLLQARPKIYLQLASLAAIIVFSGTMINYSYNPMPNDTHETASTQTPSALVTSVDGDVASVMILETQETQHTIIWYQEV